MCGIAGIYAFTAQGKETLHCIDAAVTTLAKRGPDDSGTFVHDHIALGHTRLSVIDTSSLASQPFFDENNRYALVFNGEIFNFIDLRIDLEQKGYRFKSTSDTEVLLYLLIDEGVKALEKLNGFFAFAFYDRLKDVLLLARDRYGVKPLLYSKSNDVFLFASEMKAMFALGIDKKIDQTSLYQYLQLNYIPSPYSVFEHVQKVDAGYYLQLKKGEIVYEPYYHIPHPVPHEKERSVKQLKPVLYDTLEQSVLRRLVSDVPLGSFLSGGLDSSIIAALAAKHTKELRTFSLGYKDHPLFDETIHAEQMALFCGTDHTSFKLDEDDMFKELFNMLDYIDEPFADSSALPVYILSKETRKHVTVALSGDGADELFGGYNKHLAEYKVRHNSLFTKAVRLLGPVVSLLPKSRNSFLANRFRQIQRFNEGIQLSEQDRYFRWCSFIDETKAASMMLTSPDALLYQARKSNLVSDIGTRQGLDDVYAADVKLVLQSDMLVKVDMMSMANSLEVRNPFLDKEVVEFAFTMPSQYKIHAGQQKYILKETFGNLLPDFILDRKKHGFEVPLLHWLRGGLHDLLFNDLLADDLIAHQQLFDIHQIKKLKKQLFSSSPAEVHAQLWGLLVFQYWWKKHLL